MPPESIDVEFEVIEPPRPRRIEADAPLPPFPKEEWSFWKDDLPQLVGIVTFILVAAFTRHWIFGLFHH